jgi:hypothetical protein
MLNRAKHLFIRTVDSSADSLLQCDIFLFQESLKLFLETTAIKRGETK